MSAFWTMLRVLALWPSKESLKTDIGCLGEMGRVIHWIGGAFASNFLVIGLSAPLWDHDADLGPAIVLCAIMAILIYLPARGLRRLMAGE
ncbi:MAG: hypothetical protein K1X35_07025 [Caulobacteraceae bacterium]|nr:hypothetical protein [Caulobacteraceae bacterium]